VAISAQTALFEDQPIRRVYDEATETWFFSVVDIVRVLTRQADATVARKYWNKLKQRLRDEGSELVTNCHQLKLTWAGYRDAHVEPDWVLIYSATAEKVHLERTGTHEELFEND